MISAATGGSLFLDEIGDLTLEAQGALLRFLNNGEIQPVGATRPIIANVRVIAATNHNLTTDVEAGRFREDLYYRLDVATLLVPPLRSRPGDVKALASHFSHIYSERYRKGEAEFTREQMARLVEHKWPGNVRELESCIKRLVLFGDLEIRNSDSGPGARARLWRSLSDSEKRELVAKSLENSGGNLTKAAKELGICRRTVQRVLRS